MIESRCGLLCSECDFREKMNCSGCVNIEKPFWGDSCPVKACCESKQKEYCGQCDDGKRIEQCRKWKEQW